MTSGAGRFDRSPAKPAGTFKTALTLSSVLGKLKLSIRSRSNGLRETVDFYENLAVNQFYSAVEGDTIMVLETRPTSVQSLRDTAAQLLLRQNHPNPFNTTTLIRYRL